MPDAASKFLLKISAFADTHGEQPVKRSAKRPTDKRHELASSHVFCVQDSRSCKYRVQRDHTAKVEFFLERPRFAQELGGPALVDENRRRFRGSLYGKRNLYLPAGNSLQDLFAYPGLKPRKLTRNRQGNFALSAIDRSTPPRRGDRSRSQCPAHGPSCFSSEEIKDAL